MEFPKEEGRIDSGWGGEADGTTSNVAQTKYLDIAKGTGKSKKPINYCKLLAAGRQQTNAMRHAETGV